MVGRTVGTYQLIEPIGQGGMGVVYKGLDVMVEREVAIKALRPEIAGQPDILERFRGEAIALARLNHPHIATLYSFFREGDEYFMVMEFVTGRTLESIIRESGKFPPALALSVAAQVLEAIEHASSQGILHRDIKPANVMLTPSGQVKVTDFGIARVLGNARLTREGCAYGTLEYLAPERIRGEEGDVRSDLYSLGVVLYEMLSHRLPFERATEYEMMRAHLEEAPAPFAAVGVPSIPPRVEQAVMRALAKRPEDRFGSAAEFRAALAAITAQQSATSDLSPAGASAATATTAAAAIPVSARAASTGKLRWALYAAAGLVLAAAAIIGVLSRDHARGPASAVSAPVPAQAPPAAAQSESPAVAAPATDQHAQTGHDLSKETPPQKTSERAEVSAVNSTPRVSGKAQLSRRQAALQALDESGSGGSVKKKTNNNDRRSRALDALQN
jgi:eukaryotic-like serine/threonine-protein kinase